MYGRLARARLIIIEGRDIRSVYRLKDQVSAVVRAADTYSMSVWQVMFVAVKRRLQIFNCLQNYRVVSLLIN